MRDNPDGTELLRHARALLRAAMPARLREVNPKLLEEAGEGAGD